MHDFLTENLIDENDRIIKKEELSYIRSGGNAHVWKYQDGEESKAVKIFFSTGKPFSLKWKEYKKMKKLSLSNIVKAKTVFYSMEPEILEEKKKERNFDGYIMDYIDKEDTSLFDMETSLFLQNMENLDKDAALLAQNHIMMRDLKIENSIINQKDHMLYLLDIDMYKKYELLSKNMLLYKNYHRLILLLQSIFIFEITNEKEINATQKKKILNFIRQSFFTLDENTFIKQIEKLNIREKNMKTYFLSRFN